MAAIEKPRWLRDWLATLNWDILTWRVYVGDAIEYAIDWALDWINYAIDYGKSAYDYAAYALAQAQQLAAAARADLSAWLQRLEGKLSALPADFSAWWSARSSEVQGWISAALATVQAIASQASSAAGSALAAWDAFRTGVLPGLISGEYWRTWWGGAWSSAADWWSSRKTEVDGLIAARISGVVATAVALQAALDALGDLPRDPEKWLLDRLESMLARFI